METGIETKKMAKARLSAHSGSRLVTIDELAEYLTPEPTKTWKPVPHADVPGIITKMVADRDWKLVNGFQLSVTPNGSKMFGVTKIEIPGIGDDDGDFGIAVGFRNSHDKSLALQVVVGANVFICDNLMIKGDFRVRREHTIRIDLSTELERAFNYIPEVASQLIGWMGGMRLIQMGSDDGVAFLAKCVEHQALPIGDFMNARSSFLNGFTDDATIRHGGTLWSAYQAVTEQWKKHSLMQLPEYSRSLNKLAQIMLPEGR